MLPADFVIDEVEGLPTDFSRGKSSRKTTAAPLPQKGVKVLKQRFIGENGYSKV